MEVPLRKLTDEEIDSLTHLLSRRPNYGIAVPSQKWLSRQQEKVERLPKILLEPKSRLLRKVKRLSLGARKMLGELDLAPPLPERAILCSAHERLNPFLVREVFWLLCLEVGEHLECLRCWPHKSSGMASWLTRLDSVTAYFMSKSHFDRVFGCPPHDNRFVEVVSKCEACILAAVGANGRCLADLFTALTLRRDAKHTATLRRFVDSWIRQMGEEEERTIRRWIEELLRDLRPRNVEIRSYWREHQRAKRKKMRERRNRGEGSRERSGRGARGKRPSRHTTNIPKVKVDHATASEQRRLYREPKLAQSVYRDDSIANEANYAGFGLDGSPVGVAASSYDIGSSSSESGEEEPGFGQPMPFSGDDEEDDDLHRYPQIGSTYDDSYEQEDRAPNGAEQDPEDRGAGYSADSNHQRVSEWYNNCLQDTGGSELDPEDIHPAIRRETSRTAGSKAPKSYFSAKSAVPPPLRLSIIEKLKIAEEEEEEEEEAYTPARGSWTKGIGAEKPPPPPKSEWTDLTANTELSRGVPTADAPLVPSVPPRFEQQKASSSVYIDTTIAGTSTAVPSTPSSPTLTNIGPEEYGPVSPYISDAEAGPTKSARPPLFDRRELQYPESEASGHGQDNNNNNKNGIGKKRGGLKCAEPGKNPFIRQGSTRKRGGYQHASPIPRKATPLSEANLHQKLDHDEQMKLRRDLSLSRRTDASLLAEDSASCVAPPSLAATKTDITTWSQLMKKGGR